MIAAGGGNTPLVEGSMLKMTGMTGRDHLTNAYPIAVFGDIVIRARASGQTWMRLA